MISASSRLRENESQGSCQFREWHSRSRAPRVRGHDHEAARADGLMSLMREPIYSDHRQVSTLDACTDTFIMRLISSLQGNFIGSSAGPVLGSLDVSRAQEVRQRRPGKEWT